MKSNKTINIKIGVILAMLTLLTSFVSAFAVSSPYMEVGNIKLYPGGTRDLEFLLQNAGAKENTLVQAQLTEGSEIAEIIDNKKDDIYTIPSGGRTTINLKVTIPENAQIDKDIWDIKLTFGIGAGQGGDGISFATNIQKSFQVIVIREPPEVVEEPASQAIEQPEAAAPSTSNLWIIYLIVIIIIIIIIFLIKKKKTKQLIKNKKSR